MIVSDNRCGRAGARHPGRRANVRSTCRDGAVELGLGHDLFGICASGSWGFVPKRGVRPGSGSRRCDMAHCRRRVGPGTSVVVAGASEARERSRPDD